MHKAVSKTEAAFILNHLQSFFELFVELKQYLRYNRLIAETVSTFKPVRYFLYVFCFFVFHFFNLKTFRKALFYIGLAVGALLIALSLSVYLFKDKIVNQFIREANKQLNTPITVKKIDLSAFADFPRLSVVLYEVYVEDSHAGDYPLLTASKISFQMSLADAWNGRYNITGLSIQDSETNLKTDDQGKNNYTKLKETNKAQAGQAIHFELNKVMLKNTKVMYFDLSAKEQLVFASKNLLASIASANDVYDIEATGELTTETISIDGKLYATGKSFDIKSDLEYDDIKKVVTIRPSL